MECLTTAIDFRPQPVANMTKIIWNLIRDLKCKSIGKKRVAPKNINKKMGGQVPSVPFRSWV